MFYYKGKCQKLQSNKKSNASTMYLKNLLLGNKISDLLTCHSFVSFSLLFLFTKTIINLKRFKLGLNLLKKNRIKGS